MKPLKSLFSIIPYFKSSAKFVVCLVCSVYMISLNAQGVVDYDWKQVPLGGGGYIIGMKIHPDDGDIRYFRTDIGGAYKWNQADQKLEQLIFFGNEKSHYYGVAGIALDPNNTNRVILAVGRYCDPSNTAILVSNDRGDTWSQEIVPGDTGANIYFASNGGRGCSGGGSDQDRQGAPIALNPNDPNELWIGSRGTGLWSLNISNEAFSQVAAPQIPNDVFPYSIRTVEFHPGQAQYLFIAYAGQGLYRLDVSNNTVLTINTSADIKEISDLSISKNGDYILMACKRKGIFKATNILSAAPTVYKVLDYTGVDRGDDEAFLTVTCDPENNANAVTAFSDWAALSTIRTTSNSGENWTNGLTGVPVDNIYPWHQSGEGSHISQLRYDPDNSTGLYFTSWFTSYYTADYTANPIEWTNQYAKGHEEAVITDISTFPANVQQKFLGITAGDQTGFLYSSIADCDYPDSEVSDDFDDDTNQIKGTSMDYCYSDSDHLIVATTRYWDDSYNNAGELVKENTGNIFRSTDGGASFFKSSNYDETLGRSVVAVSSDDPQRVLIANQEGLWYSTDHGATFTNSTNSNADNGVCTAGDPISATGWGHANTSAVNTSVFSTVRPIAGDKVLGCVMYFYDRNDGSFHVSTNYGEQFFKVYDGFPDFNGNRWRHKTRVIPVPDHARHVWINFKDDVFYTTDAGQSWTRVNDVQQAEALAIGKQMTNGTYPTIFLFGKANNDSTFGYYRSIDMGATWDLIHDPADKENWGSVKVMGADMDVEGRVYFSAGGLGLLYGDDPAAASCDPVNVLSNPGFENGFTDWDPRTGGAATATFTTVSSPVAAEAVWSAQIDVVNQGANYWDIQLKRSPISILAATEYKLTFDARTLTGVAAMRFGSNTANGNNFVMSGMANLTDSWQSFSTVFSSASSTDIFLAFNFGDLSGRYFIDNVRLSENCPCEDADNDTVCDEDDQCPGFDDLIDEDGNGTPDGCDQIVNCELVSNGAFDDAFSDWELKMFSTAMGNASLAANGFAKIEINATGTSNWHLGLRQYGILLQQSETYEVRYDAYADANRSIDIILTDTGGSQYAYHANTLTTVPTSYTYQFTMGANTTSNALVNLNVGANPNSVYFDNVSIQNIACDGCMQSLSILDEEIYQGEYQVATTIESNGRVNQSSQVIFKANEIILDSDFEVTSLAIFDAVISPCQ